jgi:ISXO2-like transposase domain
MITNHPKGIASTTLAKDLKITQKSAWFVLHRLRHAARTNSFNAPLKGTVEADTAFIGGKERNKHADKRTPGSQGGAGKSVVLGMVERDGELRATHISEQGEASDHVERNVERKSVLMTDEDRVFKGKDYLQLTVRHSIDEYVRRAGVIHTQKSRVFGRFSNARLSDPIIGSARNICKNMLMKCRGVSIVAI